MECPQAAQIWENFPVSDPTQQVHTLSFADKVGWHAEKNGGDSLSGFLTTAWAAWMIRNKKLFESTSPDPATLVPNLLRMVADHNNYISRVTHSTQHCTTLSNSRWSPPEQGFLKVNTDACLAIEGSVSLGVAIRNEWSEIVVIAMKKVLMKTDPESAEATALRFGLQVAAMMGFSKIHMEADAMKVVNGVIKGQQLKTSLGLIYEDIQTLTSNFQAFNISHVKRGGNTVAHLVARLDPIDGVEQIITCHIWLLPNCPTPFGP